MRKKVISPGDHANIACADDTAFIYIFSAKFTKSRLPEECDVKSIIRNICQDRQAECQFAVEESNFGNACVSHGSALELEFVCTDAPTYEVNHGSKKVVGNSLQKVKISLFLLVCLFVLI